MVDLVKRFPMSIWMQKSASIQTRTSLLKIEDHRFCRSQYRSHAEPLVDAACGLPPVIPLSASGAFKNIHSRKMTFCH